MAYSNVANVQLTNTFDYWRTTTNQLAVAVNQLANTTFVKDVGGFTLTTGAILLSKSTGTNLTVSANATISDTLTVNKLIVTTSPTFTAPPLITANDIVLRSGSSTAGNANITVIQGTSGNAQLWFDSGGAVWRTTSNVQNSTLSATLVTTRNVSDSVSTTSSSNVASLTAVKTAYDTAGLAYAAANTAGNTSTVSQTGNILTAKKLNFLNSATILVTLATGSSGNADISFASTSAGSGTVQQIITGAGLTGGPITTTGTISANLASTTAIGVVSLTDSISTACSTIATTATALKTAYDYSSNSVQVFANNNLILSRANLNFTNTSSIIVAAATGSAGNANISFTISPTITGLTSLSAVTLTATTTLNTSDLNTTGAVVHSGTIRDTPIVTVTSSGNYGSNAFGKILLCTNGTGITLTFDSSVGGNGCITIVRAGTGTVAISNTSTIAKKNTASFTTGAITSQYGSATVLYTSGSEFILFGEIT
jgi:hypothetical protein